MKSTINTVTTHFVGNYYEVNGGVVGKNYFFGGARVALRQDGVLYYPLSDHLGSTTVTMNAAGPKVSELRYSPSPYRVLRDGKTRYTSGSTPTKYQFTGQFSNFTDFRLYFYESRWFDP